MGESLPILLLVALLVMFWLVVIRPARRQQNETARLQSSLEIGDEVVISAGIFGRIVTIDDARVRLEIAPGTVIEVARQVVVRRVDDELTEPTTPAAAELSADDEPVVVDETPETKPHDKD